MLDFARFQALTFDCYGTLIDWESGILNTLRPILATHGVEATEERILETYAELESEAERAEFLPYRAVLRRVMEGFGERFRISLSETECSALSDQFDGWTPFPDTVEALNRLARRFTLNIVSNVDDALFAISLQHLKAPFVHIITAQSVGSYKPNPRNFEAALRRIGLPKERILHVAQSLYHDIAPASALGLATVWVNRRKEKEGFGATVPANATPDLEVPDLRALADYAEGSEKLG